MIIFYSLVALLIVITLTLLGFGLKGGTISQKYMMIFLSFTFCLLGLFIWLFSGITSRYTYPYQMAQTAKVRTGETDKQLRFFPLIKDGRPQAVKQPAQKMPNNETYATENAHDNNAQMQALADSLEKKLLSGETSPQSWALLARTRESIGQQDKAAFALLEGAKAFDENSEMYKKFKQDIKALIEAGYKGQYANELKAFLP